MANESIQCADYVSEIRCWLGLGLGLVPERRGICGGLSEAEATKQKLMMRASDAWAVGYLESYSKAQRDIVKILLLVCMYVCMNSCTSVQVYGQLRRFSDVHMICSIYPVNPFFCKLGSRFVSVSKHYLICHWP